MLSAVKKRLILFTLTLFSIPYVWGQELCAGLQYRKLTSERQQTIHVLDVDPKRLKIVAAHAKEQAFGRETVASIAKRYKAIAAINGGFFKGGETTDGLPAGILKIRSHWYGVAYRSRGAIGWSDPMRTVLIDRIQTKTSIYLNHHKVPLHTVNQPGLANKAVLYTDAYGQTAGSMAGGYDITIDNNRITAIQPAGKTTIPKDGFVYSLGPQARYPRFPIDIGNSAMVNIEVAPHFGKENYLAWQMVENIIGGAPLLIFNSKPIKDYSSERMPSAFIRERYARSAVGTLENGHWIFVVVEQSALTGSPGMTIPELTDLMQQLGCEYALNLDGGSSSTLYIDNAVINQLVGDDEEDYSWATLRPVSDAILLLPKRK